jgi:ABC-type cobalamin/Fe3+-siderophores transport system ATPase subunit
VLDDGRLVAAPELAERIDAAMLERVFRVRARRAQDADTGDAFWRFTR